VTSRAEEFERVSRERRLFTNNGHGSYESGWVSVPFRHPSTFETLALEPDLKKQITEDLTAFANGREFYHRVGRAWKRGYLLHGPPGSGKSSLIAAMANYLCYDVYDLELTKVSDNSELRALLIQTTNRSIIVIEDIDCTVDLTVDRTTKARTMRKRKEIVTRGCEEEESGRVTLSGLLNFTDGLWSCCGEERIIVFTTNYRDNVDPALVRCGRMDMHVSLGTCGMHAFKALVRNYLSFDSDSHPMFDVVESCVRSGGALTPAQVGEILLRNRRNADVALREVVSVMQAKILGLGRCGNGAQGGEAMESDDVAVRSPDSVLMVGSPENWVGGNMKKRKESGSTWEKKVKFLVRLRSLTKSDSGRRGV
jgi:chaperone BCS1